MEIFSGTVSRVIFRSADNGYTVLAFDVEEKNGQQPLFDGPGQVTATGNFLVEPVAGEALILRGSWVNHPKYGKQFKIEHIDKPANGGFSREGLTAYLSSGVFPGIGEAIALRIVNKFGSETEEAMADPDTLCQVRGISKDRAAKIAETWESEKSARQVMIFLSGLGITAGIARRIWQSYGAETIGVITSNPYRLAIDVEGVGFLRADQIARASMGFAEDSPYRIEAGVVHALREARDKGGHLYLPLNTLIYGEGAGLRRIAGALDFLRLSDQYVSYIEQAIDALAKQGHIVAEGDRVYLGVCHRAEERAASQLSLMLRNGHESAVLRQVEQAGVSWSEMQNGKWLDEPLAHATEATSTELNTDQIGAIREVFRNRVSVLTGGPGTGKTTTLSALLHICREFRITTLLCAPTGRAAKRMSEATGEEASTIHRALEYAPDGSFQRDTGRPVEADLVIVDETSMLDIFLLRALLLALPTGAHILFVGDVDQLPSVGAGNVLKDIIAIPAVHTTRLTQIYRQSERSAIVPNAHDINAGRFPSRMNGDADDFFFSPKDDPEGAAREIVDLVAARIPAQFGVNTENIQVLAPSYKGEAGVDALNRRLQNALNPTGEPVPGTRFRVGDRVMQLRNNYEKGVFNGDLGVIVGVHRSSSDPNKYEVFFQVDDRTIAYRRDELSEITLAYACTIHKSQGSEYDAVVISVSPQHTFMMQRNLIYTAVTRAKQAVVMVGSKQTLWMAVQRDEIQKRYTALTERVTELL